MALKLTGAWLARFALEQLGVRYTFGIPGVHNLELYDELARSKTIRPILVTHECGAAYMADAISRTTSSIGTMVIVPGAGVTHAASGIAEARLAGIPMLIVTGGVRTDENYRYHYRVHELDQLMLVKGFTKAAFRVPDHRSVAPTLYEAHRVATSGEPGPVLVEIPANIQFLAGEVDALPQFRPTPTPTPAAVDADLVRRAVALLADSRRPGLFLGWGAHGARAETVALAERLGAPVATTLQGLGVFPASHPLHAGMGFGPAAVPAAEEAFRDCDCLLAIGTRFGEIPMGCFGVKPPERLIHVDINPDVFGKNYPASIAIAGDARAVSQALLAQLPPDQTAAAAPGASAGDYIGVAPAAGRRAELGERIQQHKRQYVEEWLRHDSGGRVNPARFFGSLRAQLSDDAFLLTDDGNHTFLAAELFPVRAGGHFLSPTDFNSMGYCVPAAIAVKLAHPDRQVVGIVGDGAFLMTGMETLTATALKLGVVLFVFHDGELSQVAQFQKAPYNRKTCSVLPDLQVRGIADATGAAYLALETNDDVEVVIDRALSLSCKERTVLVDVKIDYSKATRFTQGVLRANRDRLPLGMRFHVLGRALARRFTASPEPAGVS